MDAYRSLKGLAAYSGLSVRTLRGYLRHPAHPLTHFHVGGKILVKQSEFDTWIATFRVSTAAGVDDMVADILKGL
jgi:hypothetical protein